MFGLKKDWSLEVPPRYHSTEDYEGGVARWCPGCGDHAVLSAVQRIFRDEQIPPEKAVCVSGIGCSSRFPHYMSTYGFHGLHGRAFPIACGVKSRRPELDVWVATGDGDCCSIGAGHWVHAVRYNMNMVVLLFDNNVYGLTKKQTSPTSRQGFKSNTHPEGSFLPPLNPTLATLGLPNVSFVAQTIDWNPAHLYQTIRQAHQHNGFSFVRILQRCPVFSAEAFKDLQEDQSLVTVLEHEDGIPVDDAVARTFENRIQHDPKNLARALEVSACEDGINVGLLYRNSAAPCYEQYSAQGVGMSNRDRLAEFELELDRFAI